MRIVDLIEKKRNGGEHTAEEIQFLVGNYVRGGVPDYQISAWLMAVVWRGLTDPETFALTRAMVASGDSLDLSGLAGPTLDKHSTGGVGDKTTLAVVPILAAGGVQMAKMSGRGLGRTGGTLDKLESIPGMRTNLTIPEIMRQVAGVGACICGQTDTLVPADRLLYALRDATATVESLPLVASSIMSKKLAGGAANILLDVKVGSGAFMKTAKDARALAELMVRIGESEGRRVVAIITDMNVPLGFNVGNSVEVKEIVALLKGNPWIEPHLNFLVRTLSGLGFMLAGRCKTQAEGEALAQELIASGAAFDKLCRLVAAQGGDTEYLLRTVKQQVARFKYDVRAAKSGYIHGIDASAIGMAAMVLGAGRKEKMDEIDPTAGVLIRHPVGKQIESDNVIATLHSNSEISLREATPIVQAAFTIEDTPPAPTSLVYETIGL
ncbi:pyrimidine-nucleoside phosphorylase [Capsulimonas corticalis]|uniref:Pyrimidine-nucleoside phosphorylase n=1 Tax=Capsulimonas corticalis TaxID=2219043 RepID=A0A402CQG5_9BACT|nr:thymidine phosphorylase [Capsulimonas corticalis]BDI32669.1 pyrimidine-nucleoside phosphorylase [Capsulimonas corticalis]